MPFLIGGDSINAQEKEVAQYLLDNEKALLEMLEKQYRKALNDINKEIQILLSNELTQSKIYQLEYQKALKAQIEAILEQLHGKEFESIQQYLQDCYTNAFVGAAYNLAGQGIPLIMPIDQAAIVKAIMTDSKLSEALYDALGVDMNALKKSIREEIARGISTGMGFKDIARNISNVTNIPFNRARTIVNTEGHRIQQTSNFDAQKAAKAKGAKVVKQWDSTLDGKTRDTHRQIDGQIREVDEPFEIAGKEAMFPGDFGDPAEDCNCRCVSLTRAKWALDEDELQRMQDRAKYFGLDKTENFEDFKGKYLNALEKGSQYDIMVDWNQFGKKAGRHAADYGLDPSSAEDRATFLGIIQDIVSNASEVRIGEWRGQPEDVLFFIKGADVVITKQSGEFISILKGGINNARVKNARIR